MKPLCFILMPFGKKPAGDGRQIDFDAVYESLIKPAVIAAGLEPLRADEEMAGGIIHKPMFERLILCEYAVADLTTANANVFYELGVRHATRPWATVPIYAAGWGQLPFDVKGLRAVPYNLDANGAPKAANIDIDVPALSTRLKAARNATTDSPVYQLVEGFPNIQHLKTDVFHDRVHYAEKMKSRLSQARKEGEEAVAAIETELGDVSHAESGVVVDLYLSYRAVKAWGRMIALVESMSAPLAATVLVQEQLGLALNRAGQGEKAETVLIQLIDERGPSSETCGILGRVYKDRWEAALKAGNAILARGLLNKAIAAYLQGFETDWRDAYPGVNAVTLMELRDPPDSRQASLLPVVSYSVQQHLTASKPDYWDYATLLELAVLSRDQPAAEAALANALAAVREPWEPESTARNIRLIREAWERRGETEGWLKEIEAALG